MSLLSIESFTKMTVNIFADAEQMLWNSIRRAAGNQTALYKPKNSDIETTIYVVPETPQPDGFAFEDFRLYKTSRVFKVGKLELNGIIPKEGDLLTYICNGVETNFTVKRTQSGPCYEDIGSYHVMLRLHCSIYRWEVWTMIFVIFMIDWFCPYCP